MSIENFILDKIKSSNNKITKSQTLVAEFILKNPERSTYMTANQIAMEVGVSDTTVIRFATTLGYKRFTDLQDDFRNMIINRTVQRLQTSNNKVGENNALSVSFQQDIENLKRTLEQIDETEFNEVVDSIGTANNIYIIGLRSSTADATYLGFSLNAMLGNVRVITNTGIELEDCLLNSCQKSIIIAFTYGRFTSTTVEVLQYLKSKKKCKVVTVTNSVHCPTIPFSDHIFLTEIESFTPLQSHVSSIALSNAFISAIGKKQRGKVENNLNTLEQYFNLTSTFHEK
ncbi:MurR/RpiR family transcriptional regulator [Bacillus sp. H-16]|uniref:MurR/RpiR family transcriptional regulator n=1 Tax=Alteribacter salitolerans TaxID=2912333 RepID=UPI00196673AB|nr:MurR/RpiR family transcriptional regulator [Alteribacter salitolerans]MBM7095169.1 MurR/RpiR family transcriptional regulator [Alteribacter salitolerans]